jgi:hypothetical protein
VVSYVFDRMLQQGMRAGVTPSIKRDSRNWFRNQARNVTVPPTRLIRSDPSRWTNRPLVGRMYLFQYDPKNKDKLPYYDRFPLVFPIGSTRTSGLAANRGSFLGINLHYLPLQLRARLMDALYATASSQELDETTRLRISYNILAQATKYRFFRPCIKRYLIPNVRSKFFFIEPSEWEMALFLPLDRFVGANKSRIYRDSRNRIQ